MNTMPPLAGGAARSAVSKARIACSHCDGSARASVWAASGEEAMTIDARADAIQRDMAPTINICALAPRPFALDPW